MKRVELHDANGKFAKGNKGGPGRKLGVPNKINVQLKNAIVEAASMVGFDGEGTMGLHGYLARLALQEPAVFGRLLEKLLPLQLAGNVDHTVRKLETMADLAQALKERGLPPPSKLIDVTPVKRLGEPADARR